MTKPNTPILIRSVLAYVFAHLIIARGRDVTMEFLLHEEFYLLTMCSALGICLLICILINRLTRYFDSKYDWVEKPLARLIIQVPSSIIIPVCLMTAMVSLQLFLFHGNQTPDVATVIHEFLVSGYFVLLINLLYFLRYLFHRLKQTQKVLERDFPYHSSVGL